MKAGRNDPCPCGSGKKFKKCCLTKSQSEKSDVGGDSVASLPVRLARQPSSRAELLAPSADITGEPLPRPTDPAQERWEKRWSEFKSEEWEGRRAVFLRTLEDEELMSDEMAFEMLNCLHDDAVRHGERVRFAELVSALADRQPKLYKKSAHYYLSWRLQDALADNSPDILPLTRELAARAGRDIDLVHRSLRALAYHGRLAALVEAMRVAWPFVQRSSNIVPWGISEFSEKGAKYEIYNYLEHTPSPDPRDPGLHERIRFFSADPDLDTLAEHIGDLAGQSVPTWTLDDFALKPVRKKRRDDWDDEENEREDSADSGAHNLARLISEFVGYLRRQEGVPYPKGELIQEQLFRYFLRRHEGDLDPKLSLLEQTMNPRKRAPRPPKPSHLLCPERVTFDVHLAELLGFMNGLYHTAAALFELVPAWLRFLESRCLIDADQHAKTLEELRPLHGQLRRIMESYHDDPALLHALQTWPAPPEKATVMAERQG